MPLCKYRITQLCAEMEGYGIAGTLPTRRNNPGDLRHAPHASHLGIGPDDIGIEPTIEDGWADADRQWELYAMRGLTLRLAIYNYAPPNENNSITYLAFVAGGLKMEPDTLVSKVLTVPAI